MNKSSEPGLDQRPAQAGLAGLFRGAVRSLPPAYFAMVMATGIVSLAAHAMGLPRIADALFWLNIGLYAVLGLLYLLRAAWFTPHMLGDLLDHQRAPGFLTLAAGTCVLGSQFLIIRGEETAAFALWGAGLALWAGLTYAMLAGFMVKAVKPRLEQSISGTWLLLVVAPQSIAVLGALLAGHTEQPYRMELNFIALSFWLGGGMLYVWLMGLIFYRLAFFPLSAAELAPSYWISMGAMGICTLAGATLTLNAANAPFLQSLLPFLKSITVLYWATGIWWIPVLLVLGVWRHGYKRVALRYDPAYWSIVFPLGMYAAGTFQMQHALNLPFLEWIPFGFLYLALAAWAAVFAGLIHALARGIRTQ